MQHGCSVKGQSHEIFDVCKWFYGIGQGYLVFISYLKLLRQSWRYDNASLEVTLACRGFLILRSDNSSRLMHLPGLVVLAGSKSRGMLLLVEDFLSCKMFRVLYLPGTENGSRPDTKLLLSALIKAKPAQNLKFKKQYEEVQ